MPRDENRNGSQRHDAHRQYRCAEQRIKKAAFATFELSENRHLQPIIARADLQCAEVVHWAGVGAEASLERPGAACEDIVELAGDITAALRFRGAVHGVAFPSSSNSKISIRAPPSCAASAASDPRRKARERSSAAS